MLIILVALMMPAVISILFFILYYASNEERIKEIGLKKWIIESPTNIAVSFIFILSCILILYMAISNIIMVGDLIINPGNYPNRTGTHG